MSEKKRVYGKWAGFPSGYPEDPTRCITQVLSSLIGDHGHQCPRPRGYGEKGLYCRQHAKKAAERQHGKIRR